MSNNRVSKYRKGLNNNLLINKLKIYGINIFRRIIIPNNLDGIIKILITFKIQIINNLSRQYHKARPSDLVLNKLYHKIYGI